jgi:hypothetical protein
MLNNIGRLKIYKLLEYNKIYNLKSAITRSYVLGSVIGIVS